ncbi:MAG: hypothetical protein H8E27_12360 [Verrucomicrobia subdivision 3 bacterium]|nr:hypothetical protein [Limisphaerales bacterium]
MKNRILFLPVLLLLAVFGRAAAPEAILPPTTFAMASVPDMNAARAAWDRTPLVRLWKDKEMAAFAAKLEKAFHEKVIAEVEEKSGIKLAEYWNLAQGQATMGFTLIPGEKDAGMYLIVDSGRQSDALAEKIGKLRETLVEKEVPHKRHRIRGTDVISIEAPGEAKEFAGQSIYIGQAGSLFIVTNKEQLTEQIMALHQGAGAKSLAKVPGFAERHGKQFKTALAYGWLDFAVVVEKGLEMAQSLEDPDAEPEFGVPTAEGVITALGLKGLRAISLSLHQDEDGELMDLFIDVPEAGRRGLLALFAPDAEDAGPLPFVSEDVTSFARIRRNSQAAWKTFTGMLAEISPAAPMALGALDGFAKQSDPNFSFKGQIIDTLGDDFIMMEMARPAGGEKLEGLLSSSTLFMIKSQKPAVTLGALQTIIKLAVPVPAESREFLGRTIHSYDVVGGGGDSGLHLSIAGGYLILSSSGKAIEDHLRGSGKDAKLLSKMTALKLAAAKIGGMKGAFAYENQQHMLGPLFKMLKNNPNIIEQTLDNLPVGPGQEIDPDTGLPVAPDFSEWLDFKLLPDFAKIKRYLHITVSGVEVNEAGIRLRTFAPKPPKLK